MTPPQVEARVNGERWRAHPDHLSILLDQNGLRLEQWLRTGEARIVKEGPHRTVYEVRLPELHFFLKHNRTGWRMKRSKAELEHHQAQAVAARALPTIVPLAVGERLDPRGGSFLLTHAVTQTEPLGPFLEQQLPRLPKPQRDRLRINLAHALGELVAKMHQAGALQKDMHPGNLLLRRKERGEVELYLIDLDTVKLHSALTWKQCRENLILLNRWFVLRAARTDRLRFWKAYAEARGMKSAPFYREAARDLEEQTLASNLRLWASFDDRCRENNRRFRKVRSAEVIGHRVTDFDQDYLAELVKNPDAPFENPANKVLKSSRGSIVIEMEIPLGGRMQKVIYKRDNVTKWSDPLTSLARPTPMLRAWTQGHALRQRWLPTPRPLLVLHRRRWGMLREGYLMTAKLEPTEDLHQFAEKVGTLPEQERQQFLRTSLDQLAELLRTMHERHISHRDLKGCNILAGPLAGIRTVEGEIPEEDAVSDAPSPIDYWPLTASPFWLIDLVGARSLAKPSRERKIRDLARLHAGFAGHPLLTRADKLRFLRCYLRWGLHGRETWKRWWREIAQVTEAKVRRNARYGRPLA